MRLVRAVTIAAAGVAAAVTVVDAVGWWQWGRVAGLLSTRPEAGALALARRPLLALPSSVQRSRHLAARDLAGAARETVVAALDRLGTLQRTQLPVDPVGSKNLARAALLRDDLKAALACLDEALERDPTSPYLHRLAAVALRAMGREEEMLDHLAEARALDPGLHRPALELTPEEEGRVQLDGLRRRVEHGGGRQLDSLLALAAELRRRGRSEEVEDLLAPIAAEPRVILERARWSLEDGRPGPVIDALGELSARRGLPTALRAQSLSRLAQALQMEGEVEAAQEVAQRALELVPESPLPYLALAQLARGRGDLDGALLYLRRAWGVAPTDTGILLRLAGVAEEAGELDDARLALARAATLSSERPDLAARLVDFDLRHGSYMKAAMALSRALERHPTDPALLGLAEQLRQEVGGSR